MNIISSDLKNNIQMTTLLGGFGSAESTLCFDDDVSDMAKASIKGRGFAKTDKYIVEYQSFWVEPQYVEKDHLFNLDTPTPNSIKLVQNDVNNHEVVKCKEKAKENLEEKNSIKVEENDSIVNSIKFEFNDRKDATEKLKANDQYSVKGQVEFKELKSNLENLGIKGENNNEVPLKTENVENASAKKILKINKNAEKEVEEEARKVIKKIKIKKV